MSAHGFTPPTYILSNAPAGMNPYQAMQDTLLSNMYPIVSAGYDVRIAIILAILSYTAIISLIYLVLTIRKTLAAGQNLWIARHIRQPQGLYLCFNQFLLYPISTIIMCIIWITYVAKIRSVWFLQQTPVNVYTWGAMIWIPFFTHLWTTTFGVLSGANLSSKRGGSNNHIIGPCLLNSFFVCYLPIILAILIGVGIWSGNAWHTFASLWQEQFDILGRAASTWRPGDDVDPAVQETLSHYIDIRSGFFVSFQKRQNVLMIIFIISCGILLLINVVGGFTLLSTLRSIGQFHARSANPTLSDSFGSVSKASPPSSSDYPKAYIPTASSTGSSADQNGSGNALQRLESDVTLFFLTVPPILLVAIGLYVWRALFLTSINQSGPLTELASLGIIWIYSSFAAIIMTILTLKFRTSKSRRPSIPKIKLSLHRKRPAHIIQLHAMSSDEERQGYVASPARHSHTVLPKLDKGINFDVETARDVC